jgi:hypothetical protein
MRMWPFNESSDPGGHSAVVRRGQLAGLWAGAHAGGRLNQRSLGLRLFGQADALTRIVAATWDSVDRRHVRAVRCRAIPVPPRGLLNAAEGSTARCRHCASGIPKSGHTQRNRVEIGKARAN